VKNNIVYLYATYYLMVMGKEICKENMRSLMKALGNAVDDAAEKDVMLLYEKNLVP
jgi:ribosomal protein L12E/L44/L45/RPP1/RPP2